ncbi:MAG: hypothetical protein ABJL99_18785 [Aliishimia sp.]
MDRNLDPNEILATIHASAPRRWIGVISMVLLGVLLIYVALATPPSLGWVVFLLVMGVGSLMLAQKMHSSTQRIIELTPLVLRDSTGAVIANVEDIVSVDRGFFAFKPSNGFLMRTAEPAGPKVWHPGMWWRLGKQIGVGGVTPASHTKGVAEILAIMIAERSGDFS